VDAGGGGSGRGQQERAEDVEREFERMMVSNTPLFLLVPFVATRRKRARERSGGKRRKGRREEGRVELVD